MERDPGRVESALEVDDARLGDAKTQLEDIHLVLELGAQPSEGVGVSLPPVAVGADSGFDWTYRGRAHAGPFILWKTNGLGPARTMSGHALTLDGRTSDRRAPSPVAPRRSAGRGVVAAELDPSRCRREELAVENSLWRTMLAEGIGR